MNNTTKWFLALALALLGLALAAGSVYIAQIDDAPGAALFGGLLMVGALIGAMKIVRHKR